jgi:ubiquinone/menaquinone biosynthesis C-methylase UbiE
MKNYYSGRHARNYNRRWGTFTEHTLAQVLALLEQTRQATEVMHPEQRLRVLDVACGTGRLLQQIVARLPQVEAYGVDASRDMLAQARKALGEQPQIHLEYAEVGPGEQANLPYALASFDLITCTNALHDMHDPLEILKGLKSLLSEGGFLLLEDYARRPAPFPWSAFEWLLRRIEGTYVQAYTLEEARSLCTQANFLVETAHAFQVDWLWHGWVIRARTVCSPTSRPSS